MKSTTLSVSILGLVASTFAGPAPFPAADPSPELEMIKRAPMAQVFTQCTRPNTVALTFDDGPYIYQTDISNLLNQNGIKGTFFVNGNNWDCIYSQNSVNSLRNTFNSGHQIGSHTWAHRDLNTLTWDQIHDEMWRVELALGRILGVKPAFMRPPYGNFNNLVREASIIRNQSLVIWDFDSGDSVGASVAQQKQSYTDKANQHPSNVLALNHETQETTAHQTLPFAIQALKAKGYSFATVAECLGMPAYFSTGPPSQRDNSWVC